MFQTESDIESYIRTKWWIPFQSICERYFMTVKMDFSPVWFWWKHWDLKNDGFCFSNWIFIQCYATSKDTDSPDVPLITKKITEDFDWCIKEWSTSVKEFYFITNNTLHADNHRIIETLRINNPQVKIHTWEQKRLSKEIWLLKDNNVISNILSVTFNWNFWFISIDIIDSLVSRIFNESTKNDVLFTIEDKDKKKLTKLKKKILLNFTDEDELRNVNKLMTERFLDTILKIEEYIERTNDGRLKSSAIIDKICDNFKKIKQVKNPNSKILEEDVLKSIARTLLSTDEKISDLNFYQVAIGLVLYVFEKCDIWLTN